MESSTQETITRYERLGRELGRWLNSQAQSSNGSEHPVFNRAVIERRISRPDLLAKFLRDSLDLRRWPRREVPDYSDEVEEAISLLGSWPPNDPRTYVHKGVSQQYWRLQAWRDEA